MAAPTRRDHVMTARTVAAPTVWPAPLTATALDLDAVETAAQKLHALAMQYDRLGDIGPAADTRRHADQLDSLAHTLRWWREHAVTADPTGPLVDITT